MINKKKFSVVVFMVAMFFLKTNSASAEMTTTITQSKTRTFVDSSGVGETFKITWGSVGATSCKITKTINGGTSTDWNMGVDKDKPSGSNDASPTQVGKHIFTITCVNGTATKTAYVVHYVTNRTFSANLTTALPGQTATLTWKSVNATDVCQITDDGDMWVKQGLASSGSIETRALVDSPERFTLSCRDASGKFDGAIITLEIAVTCGKASIDSFTASPASIEFGGSSALAWTTSSTSKCKVLKRDGLGKGVYDDDGGSGGATVTPETTADFDLTCWSICAGSESQPTATKTVTVTVATEPTPPGRTFTATQTSIDAGKTTILSWTSIDTTECRISDGEYFIKEKLASQGSIETNKLDFTTSFNFNCIDATSKKFAKKSMFLTVNVTQYYPTGSDCASKVCSGVSCFNGTIWTAGTRTANCATVTAAVNPISIMSPSSAYLTWLSSNASGMEMSCAGPVFIPRGKSYISDAECKKSGLIPSCTDKGFEINFAKEHTGIEMCVFLPKNSFDRQSGTPTILGFGVSNASCPTVSIDSFTSTPGNITVGGSSVLNWTTSNTTKCKLLKRNGLGNAFYDDDGGNGTATVSPIETADFDLTCWSTCSGSESQPAATKTIGVTVGGAVSADLTFTANPNSVLPGKTTTLTWKSNNTADVCKISDVDDAFLKRGLPSSGSIETRILPSLLASPERFFLSCKDATAVKSKNAGVSVAVVCGKASIDSFSAKSSTIASGDTVALTWTTSNTNKCKVVKREGKGVPVYDADGGNGGAVVAPVATANFDLACWSDCTGSEVNPTASATLKVMVTMPTCKPAVLSCPSDTCASKFCDDGCGRKQGTKAGC